MPLNKETKHQTLTDTTTLARIELVDTLLSSDIKN